jgi:hypothetical protein
MSPGTMAAQCPWSPATLPLTLTSVLLKGVVSRALMA